MTSSDGLVAALKTAQAGDTINLAAGNYTPISLSNVHFDGTVNIQSLDTAHEAALSGITVSNSSGLAFSNLNVAVTGDAYGVMVSSSSNVSFAGMAVHGAPGAYQGVGFFIRDSAGVSVTGSDVSALGSGIGHLNDDGLNISNNTVHDLQTDGIFGGGSSHVLVSGNQISSFHPQAGDHPDAIQFWGNASGAPGNDVTVSDNVIVRGTGDVIQGIFFENTNNVVITGNAMAGTMYNGIALGAVTNAQIQGNYVQGFSDMGSRIIVRDGSTNVTVSGNTVSDTIVNLHQAGGADNVNFVLGANTTIPAAAVGNVSALNTWLVQNVGTTLVPTPPGTPTFSPPQQVVGGGGVVTTPSSIESVVHDEIATQADMLSFNHQGWAIQ